MNAAITVGVQSALDLDCVGARSCCPALLEHPVLHHHGDARGPTSVLFLFDKGNIEPYP